MIDNADILLDDAMRWYIATDGQNQYIIIGRNPTGLMLKQNEIMELSSQTYDGKTRFELMHSF
ncbi:MAG: RluB protein [Clostridia bacterium]|nr:RluB protein [Clostridia bacterium]MBR6890469.1 RluB protein [Clostridia bacterium]